MFLSETGSLNDFVSSGSERLATAPSEQHFESARRDMIEEALTLFPRTNRQQLQMIIPRSQREASRWRQH